MHGLRGEWPPRPRGHHGAGRTVLETRGRVPRTRVDCAVPYVRSCTECGLYAHAEPGQEPSTWPSRPRPRPRSELRGPASASAGDQAWVPVRVGRDKALTCSWLPLTGLSCVFLPAVFTALRGSAGSQGHSRCSGSLSTGPQPFASPAGPGAWVLWPPKAQHSPSECPRRPRCTSPALPVRVGSEDAWLFEAEGVAGWRQVASGPADPAAYRAG